MAQQQGFPKRVIPRKCSFEILVTASGLSKLYLTNIRKMERSKIRHSTIFSMLLSNYITSKGNGYRSMLDISLE